jgi:riboflavin kinase
LKKIELTGRVFSGKGEGRKFLELQWVKQQIEEKTGFNPYGGTLNLRLSREDAEKRNVLEKSAVMKICPPEGYCSGLAFKASIDTQECAIVIPLTKDYPKDVLEVVASTNLRDRLHLRDDDEVTVSVFL